ncbi:MAG: hypothetical protein JWQ33_2269 [Ramlibacter sp.]|nr:hypothetical protein [Ramlibacter sp.]
MSRANAQAQLPADDNPSVSHDTLALASHMSDCERSQGPFFHLRSAADTVRALVSTRLVTTGALFAVAGLCLLLALA